MAKSDRMFPEGDDGRTIANMNVEGMPWYRPDTSSLSLNRKPGAAEEDPAAGNGNLIQKEQEFLTKEEAFFFTTGAIKAALLVVSVMSMAIILFVLFCQFIWFR